MLNGPSGINNSPSEKNRVLYLFFTTTDLYIGQNLLGKFRVKQHLNFLNKFQ